MLRPDGGGEPARIFFSADQPQQLQLQVIIRPEIQKQLFLRKVQPVRHPLVREPPGRLPATSRSSRPSPYQQTISNQQLTRHLHLALNSDVTCFIFIRITCRNENASCLPIEKSKKIQPPEISPLLIHFSGGIETELPQNQVFRPKNDLTSRNIELYCQLVSIH